MQNFLKLVFIINYKIRKNKSVQIIMEANKNMTKILCICKYLGGAVPPRKWWPFSGPLSFYFIAFQKKTLLYFLFFFFKYIGTYLYLVNYFYIMVFSFYLVKAVTPSTTITQIYYI